jgi:hypothetical protein
MTRDTLESLLEQADQAAGPPPKMPQDLPQHVLRLSARRSTLRAANWGSVASAVVLAFGVVALVRGTRTGPGLDRPDSGRQIAVHEEPAASVVGLQLEADSRLAVARRTRVLCERAARLAAAEAEAARPDPLLRVRAEVAQAARSLVQQGDHLHRELGLREPAADSYRQVLRLFPQTPSAALARQRLADMAAHEGETL